MLCVTFFNLIRSWYFTSFLWFQLESLNSYKTIESELCVIVPAISLCLDILCPVVCYLQSLFPSCSFPSAVASQHISKLYSILFHILLTILLFHFVSIFFLDFLYCAFSPLCPTRFYSITRFLHYLNGLALSCQYAFSGSARKNKHTHTQVDFLTLRMQSG